MICRECSNPTCKGPEQLREFTDWSDLCSHGSEEKIVEWVNKLNEMLTQRSESGRRYRVKQQSFAAVARKMLDPDEVEELIRQAEEKL